MENNSIRALSNEISIKKAVSVYELQVPSVQELKIEAHRWAHSLFNISEEEYNRVESKEHDDRLVLRYPEGFRIRTYYGSGYIEYRQMERTYAGKTDEYSLEDAESIIRQFGSKYALWPVDYDGQIQVDGIRFVKSQGSSLEHLKTEVITNNVILSYKRLTNGIAWIGPGSRITAMIEGRDVVAFNRYWRNLTSNQTIVQLLPIEDALEYMVDDLSSRVNNHLIKVGDIILDRAEFGYYAAGRRSIQRFLQPAYIFLYHLKGAFRTSISFVQLAHTNQFEKIVDVDEKPVSRSREQSS